MKKKKCNKPKPKSKPKGYTKGKPKKAMTIAMLLFAGMVYAQDTIQISYDSAMYVIKPITLPTGNTIMDFIGWGLDSWPNIVALLSLVLSILEVILRAIPTNRDYTVLSNINKFLDKLVKNKAKAGTFKTKTQRVDD